EPTNIGSYLSYNSQIADKVSHEDLLCVVSESIKSANAYAESYESYFQSTKHIIENADSKFKSQFFGKNKFLILFFISDSWEGVTFATIRENKSLQAQINDGIVFADEFFNELKQLMEGIKNIRSYAVIPDMNKGDRCGTENVGQEKENYPFHVYSFVNQTKGLIISICDENWGKNLENVADNLLKAISSNILYLDEIPKVETIEVFFNGKKIEKDINSSWYFDIENMSINFSSDFDFYLDSDETNESLEVLVKYYPMNLDILQKSE
ncbi:MAG: hypothetical protein OXC37_01355, partial [Bdellovibrionaceae bacterium]|nr:hypothetical protein [Pseudobdellovibrionaceae bacterium]